MFGVLHPAPPRDQQEAGILITFLNASRKRPKIFSGGKSLQRGRVVV